MDQDGKSELMNRSQVQVEIWNSKDLEMNLRSAAELRITVFRDFPYLYDGSFEYESDYLNVYLRSDRSVFVAVKDLGRKDHQLVGLSSAIPLRDENESVKTPFLKAGYDLSEVFYFGESVLLKEYRGLGLGNVFFDAREKEALKYSGYDKTSFCAVERPVDHSMRPVDYKPLHGFWKKRGYEVRPELQTYFSWKDVGVNQETPKLMTFWVKEWTK